MFTVCTNAVSVDVHHSSLIYTKAKHILIATGGRAFVPPNVQGAELGIISDQALEINPLPKSIAIIGGGYIAVEFAGIFSRLGVETHLVYRQSRPLRGFDEEVRDFATQQYDLHGLHLHPNCSPTKITKRNDGLCDLEMDGHDGALTVETVMFATGRVPNTRGLGLEEVGVQLDKRGAVVVDTTSKTTVDSIWAVGDGMCAPLCGTFFLCIQCVYVVHQQLCVCPHTIMWHILSVYPMCVCCPPTTLCVSPYDIHAYTYVGCGIFVCTLFSPCVCPFACVHPPNPPSHQSCQSHPRGVDGGHGLLQDSVWKPTNCPRL